MGSEKGDVHKDDVLNNSIMLEGPGSIRQTGFEIGFQRPCGDRSRYKYSGPPVGR
jgi:hypothetical protein